MKNRPRRAQSVFAAIAAIAVILGLSAGMANASVREPERTVTHSALAASQSAQDSGNITFAVAMAGHNAALTEQPAIDALSINSDALHPAGGGCHSYGWQFWKDWCGWTFTHATSLAIYTGAKAHAIAICVGILSRAHIPDAVAVCTAVVVWVEIRHHTPPSKHQCLAVEFHLFPPGAITVNYVKC
jgi:hypothetical protein